MQAEQNHVELGIQQRPLRQTSSLIEKAISQLNKIQRDKLTMGHIGHVALEYNISVNTLVKVGHLFESETRIKNKKHGKKSI